ncbi:MAG: hypothetical protein TH68_03560 [Candidatus Synechococcus spongiarum 142]|uniref:Methyltransferase domain-containing protein n=1 Tax=Candidatus Synechococcus spongiarum 142 TaxID=1608213 RepID=A0A6N3XCW9_9SYNE|nr:MAG: hypothetical protein TH68_03560 [Candidatus Synechococcus spongiarum 142]
MAKEAAAFWDGIAKSYAASPIKDIASYEFTLQRTRSYLKPQDKVLEIGAGTGSTALLLASSVAHITATDLSAEMMKIGQAKATEQGVNNIDFLVDGAMAEAVSGPYDVILAHNLFHLLDDLPGVLKRVNKLLKPGGLLISKTPCKPQGFGSATYRLMQVVLPIMQLLGKAPFVAMRSNADLERLIGEQGFQRIEVCNCSKKDIRRYIVARKVAGK